VSRTARLPRRVLFPAALVFAAACLTLSGCAAGQISQTADQVAAIDGANGSVGDITVLNARLAPVEGEGYAQGANGRLLLWISNGGLSADTLSQVDTPAADSVRIVGDASIPGQYLADLSSLTGTRVVVTNFTQDVPHGQSIPMTFSFENAGTLNLDIPIEIPSDRSGDRPTVDIQPPHPTPLWEEDPSGEAAGAAPEPTAEPTATTTTTG
jgi:copper(I)-binding protein